MKFHDARWRFSGSRRLPTAAGACAGLMLFGAIGARVLTHPQTAALPPPRLARSVPMRYYVSLPVGWRPDRSYPIVVTVEGVGHDFAGNFQSFVRARGSRPFIIVTPFVRSNGNNPADVKALMTIVGEVQHDDGGTPKFFVTGFSAGGHLAWQVVLKHPNRISGAVIAAGNFGARDVGHISRVPQRVELPIQAFQGTIDPHRAMMDTQWRVAEQTARAHGYQNITRTLVPGVGHSAFPEQTLDFFASLLADEPVPPGTP